MGGCFFIGFIDLMLKGKNLLDYTDLFSHNEYEKKWYSNIKMFSIIEKFVGK